MFSLAFAQTQAPAQGSPSPLVQMLPFILIFAVVYFLLIRPQQRKAREHATMVANIKKNDEIVTTGGLHGRVAALNDKVLTVEIAQNVRVRVERAQVAAVMSGGKGEGKEKK